MMEVNYDLPVPLPQQSPMPINDLSIVLVDSDVQNLQNLKLMLQQCGYNNVEYVRTAEDALWMLRHTAIDILMCEAFLPNINGFQLLSAIRKNFKSVQVILFSDHVMGQHGLGNEIVIRALELGACDFYWKPISMEVLRHMWLRVFVKKIQSCNDIAPNLPPQSPTLTNLEAKGCISEEKSVTRQKRKRDDDEEMMSGKIAPKNQQSIRWTEDMERKFTAAVDAIRCTDQEVTPSRILGLMKDMGEEGV